MFDLTATLARDVANNRAKGTTPGTKQLKAAQRTDRALTLAEQLRAAHRGTPPKGIEQMTLDLKRATVDGDDEAAARLEIAIQAATEQQAAYWDELVWASDLGANGHFVRSIYSRALDLDLIGNKPEDTVQDALEVALHNVAERPAGLAGGRLDRARRVRSVNAQMRTARMIDEALPVTRGELFRCIRYVYKRGLNQFAYMRRGQTTTVTGTRLTPTKSMTVVWEDLAREQEQRAAQREHDTKRAEVERLRAEGWIVESYAITPDRADKLADLEAEYPMSAAQLPLRLAQALVAGYSIQQFLDAVEAATGKRYSMQTLTRWANQVGAL